MPAISNQDSASGHDTTGNSGNYRGFAQSIDDDINSVTLGGQNNSSNSEDQVRDHFICYITQSGGEGVSPCITLWYRWKVQWSFFAMEGEGVKFLPKCCSIIYEHPLRPLRYKLHNRH